MATAATTMMTTSTTTSTAAMMRPRALLLVQQQQAAQENIFKTNKSMTLKTVVDSGSLTIELVRTARGKLAYKCIGRTVKLADLRELNRIRLAIEKELVRIGVHKEKNREPQRKADRKYKAAHREELLQKKRQYYKEHSAEINQKKKDARLLQRLQKRQQQDTSLTNLN